MNERGLFTEKLNATAQTRVTGLDRLPPPKQCHTEKMLNEITSAT